MLDGAEADSQQAAIPNVREGVDSRPSRHTIWIRALAGMSGGGGTGPNRFVWFVDHTSPNATDDSMTGFTYMDSRTGAMTYYNADLIPAFRAATEREMFEQQVLRESNDYKEGVKAGFDRREPVFTAT